MTNLLLDEYPLIILPGLAVKIGLTEAVILQQLHYWLQKTRHRFKGRPWVYNTYQDWQMQCPFWSVMTVRRALNNLRKPFSPQGNDTRIKRGPLVLVSRFNRVGFDKTNWWTIDYDELNKCATVQNEQTICSKWTDDLFKMNTPIPETTTDIDGDDGPSAVSQNPVILDQDRLLAAYCLIYLGVHPNVAKAEARERDPDLIRAWCASLQYAEHQGRADNLPGLVLSKLRADPPIMPVVYDVTLEGFLERVWKAIPEMAATMEVKP